MNKIIFILPLLLCSSAYAESFLTAQEFPKTFDDLSFKSKLEFYKDSYAPYDSEYDENGVCISHCAYPGLTLKETMVAIDEASAEMENLIQQANASGNNQGANNAFGTTTNTPGNTVQPTQNANNQQFLNPSAPVGVATDWCHNGLSSKLPLRYPVDMTNLKYKIYGDFGLRTSGPNGGGYMHAGLDIGTPKRTPVYATADGVVEEVARQDQPGGGGLYINIKHENGLLTQYIHLDEALVTKGQTVHACQEIAKSGNSGKPKSGGSYGYHLDYRVRFAGTNKFVDILCPCKAAKGNAQNGGLDGVQNCAHSLFNNSYKFSSKDTKRSSWRIKNGHCMVKTGDLLPDEAR